MEGFKSYPFWGRKGGGYGTAALRTHYSGLKRPKRPNIGRGDLLSWADAMTIETQCVGVRRALKRQPGLCNMFECLLHQRRLRATSHNGGNPGKSFSVQIGKPPHIQPRSAQDYDPTEQRGNLLGVREPMSASLNVCFTAKTRIGVQVLSSHVFIIEFPEFTTSSAMPSMTSSMSPVTCLKRALTQRSKTSSTTEMGGSRRS